MRKDTLTLVPELEPQTKDTLSSLINYGNIKKDLEIVEDQKVRTDRMLSSVSDEYNVIIANAETAEYTVEAIEQLSEEDVEKLYLREDGTPVPFNVPADSTRQLIDMKRDFAAMVLNSKVNMAKIDESIVELQQMQAEYNEEVQNIFAEFNGDVSNYTRIQLTKRLEELDPASAEARGIAKVLDAMDDALDLNSLYETYAALDTKNTIDDFFRRSENIAMQFMRNMKNNGVAVDFSKYDFLEYHFLDKKHWHFRNLFIFTLVKKYAKKKTFTRADAIFLTQLIVNIQVLLYDDKRNPGKLSEEQQAKRARLIAGIDKVMGLFEKHAPVVEDKPEAAPIIGVDLASKEDRTAVVTA